MHGRRAAQHAAPAYGGRQRLRYGLGDGRHGLTLSTLAAVSATVTCPTRCGTIHAAYYLYSYTIRYVLVAILGGRCRYRCAE